MELTAKQALKNGIQVHKAGKALEAIEYDTSILKVKPKHPDINHNMGILAIDLGKIEVALPYLKTAVDIKSSVDQY